MLARAAALARQQGIYLQLGVIVFRATDRYPFLENRAILLDPSGATVWDYHKARPTPGENQMVTAGPPVVPFVTTPYGRLATVICYDADFPDLVRQAGHAGADILLVPSKDWQSVSAQHARMATFRALEDGLWVVRPVSSGVSEVVEHGATGVLAQPGDVEGLCQGILRLLEDGERRLAMGERAREHCRAHFDIQAIAPRYLDLYRTMTVTR